MANACIVIVIAIVLLKQLVATMEDAFFASVMQGSVLVAIPIVSD